MTFWKSFWASLLACVLSGIIVLVLFFLFLNLVINGFGSQFEPKGLVIEDHSVLHMKLDGQIGDHTFTEINPSSFQITKQLGLNEILEGITLAKNDDRIKGIFLNCDNLSAGMATVKEIRDGLAAFQSEGKFIVAYHENYDKKAYYLSSVAKELYVYESGMLDFLGLGAELVFLKGALEKLDVEMQIIRGSNNKFKSAVEPLIYDKMSAANREQTKKYLDALWGQMTSAISKSRGVSVAQLNVIADSAFIRKSKDAVTHQLADATKYYDEVLAILEEKAGTPDNEDLNLVSFEEFAVKMTREERILEKLDTKNLAVIFAEGDIIDGGGSNTQIGGTSLSSQIREARLDSSIQAVVLRINSPGGSALASDIIWREVELTKEVKPVVVSMGDVAASGGYYIACGADRIFAQENTITGSIGVFGIIPYTGDMFKNKLGVSFDRVQTNEHSILSLNKRLTDTELDLIQEGVDGIYDDFISKVAVGRNKTKAEIDSIGQGRVWAGTDAIKIGLVDEFGGLQDAIDYAMELAEIPVETVKIKYFPEQKNDPFLMALEAFDNGQMQMSTTEDIKSQVEIQIMDLYSYVKTLGTANQIQARLPYLLWID